MKRKRTQLNRTASGSAGKLVTLCIIFLWLAGCSRAIEARPTPLVVFAAASLTDAFTELATAFEAAHPEVNLLLNFGGSSQLAAQLREGVDADVFASANPAQMEAVIAAGRVAAGADRVFASNQLTVIVPGDNPANVTHFADLGRPGVQLLLAVQGVPVRAYTDEIVAQRTAVFQSQFYANVVSEEDNVRQVAAKIALGEADAGIVYTSDVTPDIASQVKQIAIPDAQNVVATYPIAPLADAPQPELAQLFIEFILSSAGQEILSRWGFGPPPGER